MSESNIYRPYSRLIRIRVLDRWFEVPENNLLLRCFQYIAPAVPYGPFCWNGDCENDRVGCAGPGSTKVKAALACQTLVKEGMGIDSISPELMRILAPALQGGTEGSEKCELVAAGSDAGGGKAPSADDPATEPGAR